MLDWTCVFFVPLPTIRHSFCVQWLLLVYRSFLYVIYNKGMLGSSDWYFVWSDVVLCSVDVCRWLLSENMPTCLRLLDISSLVANSKPIMLNWRASGIGRTLRVTGIMLEMCVCACIHIPTFSCWEITCLKVMKMNEFWLCNVQCYGLLMGVFGYVGRVWDA